MSEMKKNPLSRFQLAATAVIAASLIGLVATLAITCGERVAGPSTNGEDVAWTDSRDDVDDSTPSETSSVPTGTMGAASDFAVLGLNGTRVNLHNVTVTGDVGVGPRGVLNFEAPSSVNGDILVDATATISRNQGTLNGSRLTGQDLSVAVSAALNVASMYAAMAPTQPPIGTIKSSMAIQGNGGLNVIPVGSINMGGSGTLTLSGGPNDRFVLNVTGGITLGGDAKIVGGGSVQPWQILINVVGTGTKLTSHVNNLVNAIILAPQRSIEFHSVNGQVIAGGAELKLMSDSEVVQSSGGGENPPGSE